MKQLIDELKSIPGVIGACLYSSRDGLKASNLPGIFKPERLAAVGKQLAKLCSAGRMSFDDLTDVSLHYDESVVVARELQKNLLVFAVCDPAFNHNLLTMAFNLLQEEILEHPDQPPPAAAPLKNQAAPVPLSAEPHLEELLDGLKGKLGKILGPMAGFIFDEVCAEWKQQGRPVFANIDSFIELLGREIGDADKLASYRQLIAPLLRAYPER